MATQCALFACVLKESSSGERTTIPEGEATWESRKPQKGEPMRKPSIFSAVLFVCLTAAAGRAAADVIYSNFGARDDLRHEPIPWLDDQWILGSGHRSTSDRAAVHALR